MVEFRGEKLSNKTHRCAADPDARLYRKGPGKEAELSYFMHDLVDPQSGVILARSVAGRQELVCSGISGRGGETRLGAVCIGALVFDTERGAGLQAARQGSFPSGRASAETTAGGGRELPAESRPDWTLPSCT